MSFNSIADSDIETTACPLCKSSSYFFIHAFDMLKVVKCKKCGLFYLSPRLKESAIKSIYRDGSYFSRERDGGGYVDYSFQRASLRTTFRRLLSEMKMRGMTKGRLLEVGSGYGYFLSEAKNFFPSVSGIELSAEACNHAQNLCGVAVHAGDIASLPSGWSNFDVVVTINVIEHIYEPVEFLISLKQRLKNDGRIVIATPDIGSFWYKVMKSKWPSFKLPEHVAFYTNETLTLLLKQAGFSNITRLPFLHAFPMGLIGIKLGLPIPKRLSEIPIWLPKTMIALTAEVTL